MLTVWLVFRVPPGCGTAAGQQRQSGQPEQSPEAGEGGGGTGQRRGAAAGEQEALHRGRCRTVYSVLLFLQYWIKAQVELRYISPLCNTSPDSLSNLTLKLLSKVRKLRIHLSLFALLNCREKGSF